MHPSLLKIAVSNVVMHVGVYLVGLLAVLSSMWLFRNRLASRKIQDRARTPRDSIRELRLTFQSLAVYVFLSIIAVPLRLSGFTLMRIEEGITVAQFVFHFLAMVIAHDAWFYWTHRAMHHPSLFKTWHRAHHLSVTPSPLTAYSCSWREAAVHGAFVAIWILVVPVPLAVVPPFMLFQLLRNMTNHAGYELHPSWFGRWPFSWLTTSTHHDSHHAGRFDTNYGLYFRWWDRICGTEDPDYEAKFRQASAPDARLPRQPANVTTDSST